MLANRSWFPALKPSLTSHLPSAVSSQLTTNGSLSPTASAIGLTLAAAAGPPSGPSPPLWIQIDPAGRAGEIQVLIDQRAQRSTVLKQYQPGEIGVAFARLVAVAHDLPIQELPVVGSQMHDKVRHLVV